MYAATFEQTTYLKIILPHVQSINGEPYEHIEVGEAARLLQIAGRGQEI